MSRSHRKFWGALGAGLTAALVGGLIAAPAQAAPAPAAPLQAAPPSSTEFCPGQPMAPVSTLTEGDAVTWSTTVKGTVPETFGGEYIGKIKNGLGNGADGSERDLLLVKLSGPQVDGTSDTLPAGVWAGASGSPVYDASGALIGAVSYGFSSEADNVAGVTPAAAMQQIGELPGVVRLSDKAKAAIKQSTGETPKSGARQLRPVRVVTDELDARAERVAKRHKKFRGAQKSGLAVSSAASGGVSRISDMPDLPIVAGGNIAVSFSYGAITAASVGTVTAVCGDKVWAFGHPDEFDSTLTSSLHGASAARIVPSAGDSYKEIEQIGRPVGVLTEDRMAGIRGDLGRLPDTVTITTRSRVGTAPRQMNTTKVSEKKILAPAAYTQLGREALRLLDNASVGSAKVTWKIGYQRANGQTGTLTNANRYSSTDSFIEFVGMDIADDVASLQSNEFETVRVTGIDVTTDFSEKYAASRVAGLQLKSGGTWKTLKPREVVPAKRGASYEMRAVLHAAPEASNGTEYANFKVTVPKSTLRNYRVEVGGGDGGDYDELFFDEGGFVPNEAVNFPGLVRQLDDNSRNDRVTVSTQYLTGKGAARKTVAKEREVVAPQVMVGGSHKVTLQVEKQKPKKQAAKKPAKKRSK